MMNGRSPAALSEIFRRASEFISISGLNLRVLRAVPDELQKTPFCRSAGYGVFADRPLLATPLKTSRIVARARLARCYSRWLLCRDVRCARTTRSHAQSARGRGAAYVLEA